MRGMGGSGRLVARLAAKTHYRGNVNDSASACGNSSVEWSLDPHATTCGHCLRSKTYPFAERKAAKVAPTLPRAVRELLRDVVLRRAWYAGAINDCPASSGEMADRAAKLLGTTREDIVRRAKAKR